MRRLHLTLTAIVAGTGLAGGGVVLSGAGPASMPRYLDQGSKWGDAQRSSFYSMDQGSEVIPLAWARALKAPDGKPFLGDRLARYGYLPIDDTAELPIGFVAAERGGITRLGMTCAACHTRQIEVDGAPIRIDGGPALSDFQQFLADLDHGVGHVLADNTAFGAFANQVLTPSAGLDARAVLRQDVAAWYHRQHTLFARALPVQPWGVGRLDAVSMILNRVSGLDIGAGDDGIIAGNIRPADAPVRYPFIWNAPRQDHTQWPGFASNGDVVLGAARNLGEVYGVFASFHPVKNRSLLGYDFLSDNSANFTGLDRLEGLVRKIGAPVWPWPTDADQAARGAQVFAATCNGCHGKRPGVLRPFPISETWQTPLVDVGTDTHEYDIMARRGDTGVLQGAVYGSGVRLQAQDRQFNILAASVIGTLADRYAHNGLPVDALIQPIHFGAVRFGKVRIKTPQGELAEAYHSEVAERAATSAAHPYEARVLHGVWAAAPYLHNGSVASLAQLLEKPVARMPVFAVGPAYDLDAVGLASVQPGIPHLRKTTGCEDLKSGNSRCGHVYGTNLPPADKRDLLEYLKTL